MKSENVEIAIVGGGLAGLVNALELARSGRSVVLIERKNFPRHKVCGEYVSNEIKPYLQKAGAYPKELNPVIINNLKVSGPSGKTVSTSLKMGGFGISRYAFDHFLAQKAQEAGAEIRTQTQVKDVHFEKGKFQLQLSQNESLQADVVIGAHGKRSGLDKTLKRDFIGKKTDYVGIKRHYQADFEDNEVHLHNFEGGYCGLSRVESGAVNLCYLIDKKVMGRYSGIEELEQKHLTQNPHLQSFLEKAYPFFKKPLVISQINFISKPVVEDHVLMSGDAAGLIHPFCGNGMAMAIHSARLCATAVEGFLSGQLSRQAMEAQYQKQWQHAFSRRLNFGRKASALFGKKWLSELALKGAKFWPGAFSYAVEQSHGKEVTEKS